MFANYKCNFASNRLLRLKPPVPEACHASLIICLSRPHLKSASTSLSSFVPMHPSPMADTFGPFWPSCCVCILSLLVKPIVVGSVTRFSISPAAGRHDAEAVTGASHDFVFGPHVDSAAFLVDEQVPCKPAPGPLFFNVALRLTSNPLPLLPYYLRGAHENVLYIGLHLHLHLYLH